MKTQVLIVEDDLSQRPLWEMMLKRQFLNFELDWAVNFEEAKKLWRKSYDTHLSYDLVIADIFLAGPGTGLDFIELKKQMADDTPFLLVTSIAEADVRDAYPEIPNHIAVLTKPLNVPRCDRAFDQLFPPNHQRKVKEPFSGQGATHESKT